MITLTRLNGDIITVNAELIETVEATPDSIITLTTGKKFVVKESVEEIIAKTITYKQAIYHRAVSL
ncbi:MAG: flagellar FlbD family protein [Bacillota bacterium]|uniref:Endoflagellar protein n=1 Tax=Thermanaerosceptrum fracticalcis TaxID=1712410 RepID=A0A7G6E110_THEFR|nr:flagellar FlbD family protein [Thermanaerosceptrum fracticalcis]QNB45764.1 endoflagellar protein [Thermanaerosceptrum fracticalcis]